MLVNNIADKLESPLSQWQENRAKSITFIVTEDCQLRCNYCYMVGKNKRSKMDFSIAKKTVDYLINNRETFPEKSVIWDFIGGEPFLEIELIDEISDYIKRITYEESHPWFDSYRLNFSTNGLLYDNEKVQKYISKNKSHVEIGISIDGTEQKHNLQRVFPNGRGSYKEVAKNIPLWLEQFPNASTKVTIASEDVPYIKDSVLHLFSLGIKSVNINAVFEDVWKENDDKLFEEQLIKLADSIIEQKLYKDFKCSFFNKTIGNPLDCILNNQNWCGAGKMLCVDHTGDFYPCVRFAPFSLQNKIPRIVGNCFDGMDHNKLRPFLTLDMSTQSPQKCMDCDIAAGCAWCQAANYDFAETDTIYQRVTYICKIHKARVRANNYFWHKMDRKLAAFN